MVLCQNGCINGVIEIRFSLSVPYILRTRFNMLLSSGCYDCGIRVFQ